ncbi:MAG: cation:proton antiporter [Planctomycetes bacterium]|nr:cation:proton antiporter [Planctomycetota bacterium]
MHLDPILSRMVGVTLAVLLAAAFLRLLRQPYSIGYLLAGVALGPYGAGVIDDEESTKRLGAIGVDILLFFVGMEVSLPKLARRWRVASIGTLLQIGGSVGFVALIGAYYAWPFARILLLGFVISLSSTAVVIKLLQDYGELETPAGQNVVAVLLAQDLAVVPMLLTLQMAGGVEVSAGALALQVVGGVAVVAFLGWLLTRDTLHLPLGRWVRGDHELQVFSALILCFGLALLTGLLGLSTALGAFVAGVVVATARETHWVSGRLESFRVVFVALFFVSIGMLIDLRFVRDNAGVLGGLLFGILVTNTLLNASILRVLGDRWRSGLYAGAMLSPVGEFSFVLGAAGLQAGIVTEHAYRLTVAVIALSLIASPIWIAVARLVFRPAREAPSPAPAPPASS